MPGRSGERVGVKNPTGRRIGAVGLLPNCCNEGLKARRLSFKEAHSRTRPGLWGMPGRAEAALSFWGWGGYVQRISGVMKCPK